MQSIDTNQGLYTDKPMDVLQAIALRQSVRQYRPDPIPNEILMALLDAVHQAPSSWNLQPWEFVVVTDPAVKHELSTAVTPGNVPTVQTAAATFVCLGSLRQQNALAKRLEEMVMKQDDPERRERAFKSTVVPHRDDEQVRREHVLTNTYIGITQLVLAAQKFGLATLWMGGFYGDKVRAVLGIPDDYLVASLVSVGWPVEEPQVKPRKRRPLEEIYSMNRFGSKE